MSYGNTEVSKSSKYINQVVNQKISPLLKDKLVFIGQEMCYENAADIAQRLLGIQTNDTAIYRLTDEMGQQMEEQVDEGKYHTIEKVEAKDVVYCQVDGSMLLTREEKWKETKLGRVFKASDIYSQTSDRQWLRGSEYIAHLGHHNKFEEKISHLLDKYEVCAERLVFINDGAPWIGNWITAEYPRATQILDFYHAMSHISAYSKLCVLTKKANKEWLSQTAHILKTKGYEQTIKRLEKLKCNTKVKKEEKKKLFAYLGRNEYRMDYPSYIEKGWLIGSGAIESAHRTVLQHRLKKSGQRWSKKGLKNIMRLRVINKSGHWDIITQKLRAVA